MALTFARLDFVWPTGRPPGTLVMLVELFWTRKPPREARLFTTELPFLKSAPVGLSAYLVRLSSALLALKLRVCSRISRCFCTTA